ncbi:MAG: hypothetical protein U9P14_11100, partial [Gemmatimonadota bacterium]|nr:hypothetical protein [Gemmatimonadota bacterium]
MTFHKQDIEKVLTAPQKKKLNNFLQRLKRLKVLRSGETRGEYIFNSRMTAIYIWMQRKKKK